MDPAAAAALLSWLMYALTTFGRILDGTQPTEIDSSNLFKQ